MITQEQSVMSSILSWINSHEYDLSLFEYTDIRTMTNEQTNYSISYKPNPINRFDIDFNGSMTRYSYISASNPDKIIKGTLDMELLFMDAFKPWFLLIGLPKKTN